MSTRRCCNAAAKILVGLWITSHGSTVRARLGAPIAKRGPDEIPARHTAGACGVHAASNTVTKSITVDIVVDRGTTEPGSESDVCAGGRDAAAMFA